LSEDWGKFERKEERGSMEKKKELGELNVEMEKWNEGY
jgi:hypothetical protein